MAGSKGSFWASFGLLSTPRFGVFLLGRVLSTCGMWIQNLAAAVLMFDIMGTSLMVGMVTLAQFVPLILFSLWAGALTDRFDRRKLLLTGRFISGSAVLVLGSSLLFGELDRAWVAVLLLSCVFVAGIGWAISHPAMQALVPGLVPRGRLEDALALAAFAPGVGRSLGPVLGAAVLVLGGPAAAFLVAGCAHLTFAVILLFIRARVQGRSSSAHGVLGGLSYLKRHSRIGALVLAGSGVSLGADPVLTLAPALVAEISVDQGNVGVLVAAFGVGALFGTGCFGVLRRWFPIHFVAMLGFWLMGLGLLSVAASPGVVSMSAAFFLNGFGFMISTVGLTASIQSRVPDGLRGRVMALWGLSFLGSRPIVAIMDGLVADFASVRVACVLAGVFTALYFLFARLGRYRA